MYSSMSMSSGLMRRSLARASLIMLMALHAQEGQLEFIVAGEIVSQPALDTRWQQMNDVWLFSATLEKSFKLNIWCPKKPPKNISFHLKRGFSFIRVLVVCFLLRRFLNSDQAHVARKAVIKTNQTLKIEIEKTFLCLLK